MAAGGYLWVFVQVFLHETAHVVAARLAGLSPFAIVVGRGPQLFQGHVWGLDMRLHLLPYFGAVHVLPALPGIRWRGAIFSIAGLLMDIALLCLLVGLAGVASRAFGPDHHVLVLFFFVLLAVYQAIVIMLNLIPIDVKIGAATVPNDGKQFLGYLIKGRSVALDTYREMVARYDPTFRIEDSWQVRGDISMLSLLLRAEEDIAAKRYADGVEKYLRIIDQPRIHPAEKAKHLDRLACIPIMEGEKSFLTAAEKWSRDASALAPESRTVRGTRGAILVETGSHAEGLELLMPLTSENNARIDRVISSCYAAKALHGLGRTAEAREWMTAARAYGEFPSVLSRIESELK